MVAAAGFEPATFSTCPLNIGGRQETYVELFNTFLDKFTAISDLIQGLTGILKPVELDLECALTNITL